MHKVNLSIMHLEICACKLNIHSTDSDGAVNHCTNMNMKACYARLKVNYAPLWSEDSRSISSQCSSAVARDASENGNFQIFVAVSYSL